MAAPPHRTVVTATAALALPQALAFAALVAGGFLEFGIALLAAIASIAITGVIVRFGLAAFGEVRAVVDRLARSVDAGDDDPPDPQSFPRYPPARDLAVAATHLAHRFAEVWHQAERDSALIGRVVDRLPEPLLLVGSDLAVQRQNRAATDLLGRRAVGENLTAVLREPTVIEATEAVLDGADGRDVDFILGGQIDRDMCAFVRALPADDGSPPSAIVLVQDLTALKAADRLRSDFVANVSHELKTPLSSLAGFIETLRGPASDDAAARARFLEIMQEQGQRMIRIVDDLMSLSRIEMDEHVAPTGEVPVVPIVQGVVASLQPQAGAKSIKVSIDLPAADEGGDRPLLAIGDRDQITQVVQNLLDNAIKYGREDSTVGVSVRHQRDGTSSGAGPDNQIAIAVADQGDGIAPDHLTHLTERFYRVDSARSRALGGTGLGLAIVKHILNRHRATLTIESTVGEGSTFTVRLPAVSGAVDVNGDRSDEESPSRVDTDALRL